MTSVGNRIVVLIDMDCFFCQVETKLQPQYKGKPLAVVQYNQWKLGKIIAVNYEARNFGVTRHMRGMEAKEKCPDIVLVSVPCLRGKADTSRYRKAGREVIEVIKRHCNTIERASVDEAYLDITDIVDKKIVTSKSSLKELILSLTNTYIVGYSEVNKNDEEERYQGLQTWLQDTLNELHDMQAQRLAVAGVIVEEIRTSIYKETGFKCSAGISQNKILAKLACGLHKPNCQTILPEIAVPSLYSKLPIKKIRNLGGKFGDIVVESLGCNVMEDLLQYSLEQLQKHFDEKTGFWLYNIARGIDNEPVINRLLSKSIAAFKTFPGKQAITSLEVLKNWAQDLAAEVCERLEEDLAENHRRATLLIVSYSYYQNRSTISQTRSFTLNSYKSEKMANQCIEVVTKSTQCPLTCIGLSASKFVPSKESNSFLKFFKTDLKHKESNKNSEIDKLDSINSSGSTINSKSNLEAGREQTLAVSTSKEESIQKMEEEKSQSVKESSVIKKSIIKNSKVRMKESKGILDNSLNMSSKNSPISKRVMKLIQVCNERNKAKDKHLSSVVINNNDFQDSFFMNAYKTGKKECFDNTDRSIDIVKELECRKQSIVSNTDEKDVNNKNNNDYSLDLCVQENDLGKPSTSYAYTHVNSNGQNSTNENNEEISAQEPSVRLREIFPNVDDIDPDILSLLPAELQEEAKLLKSRSKKQENIKIARDLPKSTKGRPSKFKAAGKSGKTHSLLSNFLIKTNSSEHDVPLERCAECDQMIPLTKFSEHTDFHVAQNIYREINKPTLGENGVKRKLENAESDITSMRYSKRTPSNACKLDRDSDRDQ
ncbi:DNA polymerase eta [Linepithema humile]|uniref:DNA polymerase eta n=1 Tax=Linepithema humile TaxID=83485 RepID=UPI00062364AB|nr:PREDICTED: DNA polymerase eta [Linepithema humile]